MPRGDHLLVAATKTFVSCLACQSVCAFAPRGVGEHAFAHGASIRRISVLAIEPDAKIDKCPITINLATNLHRTIVRVQQIEAAFLSAYEDVDRNHTLQMAAALSYYFVMSLFPALVLLSAFVAYLPLPDLFDQALGLMSRFVPPDSMGVVHRVVSDVVTPNRGAFLSFGLLGTLWAASGGFAAAIEALNIAYDVEETRPFGKHGRWRSV